MKTQICLIISWLFLMSCDPCRDCGEPLTYDPSLEMIFINADSAETIQQSILANTNSIAANTLLRGNLADSIKNFSDSLLKIDSLIEAGEIRYLGIQEELIVTIELLTAASDDILEQSSDLRTLNTSLNSIFNTIQSGSVQLQRVFVIEANREVEFEDSMTQFQFPILLNATQTSYEITIDGQKYSLSIGYEQVENINDARVISLQAINIDTISHTFDSLGIDCLTAECLSNETSFTVYF